MGRTPLRRACSSSDSVPPSGGTGMLSALFVVTVTSSTSPSSITSCQMPRTAAGYVTMPAGDLCPPGGEPGSVQARRAISRGKQGSVTGTGGARSWLVGGPSGVDRSDSQADSASSILVTRSHRECPGQGGNLAGAGCPACLDHVWLYVPSGISVYQLDSFSV